MLLLCIILKDNIVRRYSNWIGVLVWEVQYIVVSDIFTATLGFFSTIICLFFFPVELYELPNFYFYYF